MDKETSTNSSIGDWELLVKAPDPKEAPPTNPSDTEQSGIEEIKKCHLDIPKLSADGEISDGISVISEDELDECHAGHQEGIDWHKEELQIGHQRKKSKRDNEQLPLTPPSTPPTVEDDSDKQIQTLGPTEIQPVVVSPPPSPINFKKLLLFGGLATMILAILINNYQLNNLKNRGESDLEQRLTDLEIEKDMLRVELERLKEAFQVEEVTPPTSVTPDRKRRPVFNKQRQQQQLNDQKIVWSGQENDPLVIPDSMNILPDFCTKTYNENDDLYDEYNQVLCEKIQRKLDSRNTDNYHKKFNKELNKLRQVPESNPEIFVDIETEDGTTEREPPKNFEKENENKRMTKEQHQSEKQTKQQEPLSNNPKKRMTKEEYEQMKKDKTQQKQKYNDENKNNKSDRNDRSTVDGSGGARAHHENKDKNGGHDGQKKRQYTVEEQRAYQEMKEKEKQQRDYKHKDRHGDNDGRGNKDKKRQYTVEEQRAYHEMKEKERQQKKHKDKNGDSDGLKDQKRLRKDSEENYDRSNEWHGKRMESREHARQHKKKDENWYLERGSNRENHRDHSGEKKKNWYLDRADEREVARTAGELNYQKYI